jgi:hypothetical protein
MFYDDTALIRMTIDEIASQNAVSYENALKLFYTSPLARELSDKQSWYQTYAPADLAKKVCLRV